jgi:RND family efflux transporter MFP subunit
LKPRNKRIFAGVAVLVLALSALVLRARNSPIRADEAPAPARAPAHVVLSTANLTTVPQYLDATGLTRAELEAVIATKIQGRVLRVFVREGERVRRGQPLVQMDARDLSAAVAQASAGVRSASVGYGNAQVAASMEQSMSAARIAQAEASLANAQAALEAARAKAEMVVSGPRRQERTQSGLAVAQAQSGVNLAQANLGRMKSLFEQGAISRQQLDTYQSQYEVAKAQYDTARESQSISDEGSRSEDIRAAREGVRQAEAGIALAKAGVKQARAAAKQADVRRAEILGAKAQVGQGQAALQMARVTLDYATIVAPFDGVVTRRSVDPGSLATPGTPLLTLQGGDLRLEATVPESSLSSVRPGSTVPVDLDAFAGRPVTGRVVEISPQGDPASHTFTVKVRLPADSGVRSGMFGRARFRTGTGRQILVPTTAILPREGLTYVYAVGEGRRASLRLVTTAAAGGHRTAVLSGLQPGERVVTSGAVSDGQSVEE